MEIRVRATGAVMFENEFRDYVKTNNGPTWDQTTPEILEALDADPVFEGPSAHPLEFWQYSMRQGVEQIDGKWYTKYIPGPVFEDTPEATAAEQQADYIAQKTKERNAAIVDQIVSNTQTRLDDFAKTRNYDGILSACTYVTSTILKFQSEGQYCVEARDATWAKLYEILAEVEAGTRPAPTSFADVEPELPVLTWPA